MMGLALLAMLLAACGDNLGPCSGHSGAPPPATCASGACTDLHVVAHEDDDLLFMNPDIASELAGGDRVVVVYVTAGELADPTHDAYWIDRERGMLAAYASLLQPAPIAYRNGISDLWNASTDQLAGLTFTTYRAGALALVFLRLGDYQTQCLWEDANGCSMVDAHPAAPPYLAATKPCAACAPPIAAQQVSREQLIDVLAQLIEREGATSVATLDSTNVYFDALGPAGDGYHEYWDHYFTALFATAAAARTPVRELRAYRGYTIAREPANLDDDEACAKLDTFAHYAIYDTSIVRTDRRAQFVECPSCYFRDAYGVTAPDSWEQRQYVASSLALPAHFVLRTTAGCLTDALAIGDCANAAVFAATAGELSASAGCLEVVATDGHIDTPSPDCGGSPCTPVPPIYPPAALQWATCGAPTEATSFVPLDDGQIRTANGRCLTAGATVTSDDCRSVTTNGHVTGRPDASQAWTIEAR